MTDVAPAPRQLSRQQVEAIRSVAAWISGRLITGQIESVEDLNLVIETESARINLSPDLVLAQLIDHCKNLSPEQRQKVDEDVRKFLAIVLI